MPWSRYTHYWGHSNMDWVFWETKPNQADAEVTIDSPCFLHLHIFLFNITQLGKLETSFLKAFVPSPRNSDNFIYDDRWRLELLSLQ